MVLAYFLGFHGFSWALAPGPRALVPWPPGPGPLGPCPWAHGPGPWAQGPWSLGPRALRVGMVLAYFLGLHGFSWAGPGPWAHEGGRPDTRVPNLRL